MRISSSIILLASAAFVSQTVIGCSQNKDKKTNLTRVTPGSQSRVQRPQINNDEAPGRDANRGTEGPTQNGRGAQNLPDEAASTIDLSERNEVTTELCRLTDDPKLDAEQKKQNSCRSVAVETDADGKIQYKQLHSLVQGAAVELKATDAKIDDKKVVISINSLSAAAGDEDKKSQDEAKICVAETSVDQDTSSNLCESVLYLAYKIPHKASELRNALNISVKVDQQTVDPIDYDIQQPEGTDEIIVRLVYPADSKVIENINYNLEIEYRLK